MRLRRLAAGILSLAVLTCLASVPAAAQFCTAGITNIDFGTIDVTANTPFVTTGTYSISCSGFIAVSAVRSCPNIGTGDGGGDSSGNPRYLTNGSNQLAFNLFSDPAHSIVWGSRYWVGAPPTVNIPLFINLLGIQIGSNDASQTIYARIPGGQQTVPPGTYTSTFAANHTALTYIGYLLDLPLLAPSCENLLSPDTSVPFTVTATVAPNCFVAANTLNFGTTGILASNIDAATTLSVTCTATTPYTVSLNGGATGASDPLQRKMTKGSEAVTYGLYRDASRVQPWGDTIGINTVAGVGTGFPQHYSVYGRVTPQQTPSPGTYTDTIIATVTY